MGWEAELDLAWRHEHGRTLATFAHRGPLRVLKPLYPEGPAICHHVVVHPPGGVVGGDVLTLRGSAGEQAHALLTTPGATRFYRSAGDEAVQRVEIELHAGARLEWLPAETIVHDAARAANRLRFELEASAQMIGWDLLALGLPASNEPFERGRIAQRIEIAGVWLDEGRIDAADRLLLDSPLGFAGRRALATAWWVAGSRVEPAVFDAALQAARAAIESHDGGDAQAAATSMHERLVVVRALAHRVEPLARLLRSVRAAWRSALWQLEAPALRVWAT